MIGPAHPLNEVTRLSSLRSLHILDTAAEERFDRLARLAKRLFGVPIVMISLVDANRQWFKSCVGLNASEMPRDISFCGHTILGDDILIVPDASLDERFHDNPLVIGDPKVRFYAGCPVGLVNGDVLGTLCLMDQNPREPDDEDCKLLRDLARLAEQEIAAPTLATMCDLTLLSNRRGFLALGRYALSQCARCGMPATISFFDLDGFKLINDRFGHAEGDGALASFGALLKKTFRDCDVVGRLGGDEFAVLLTRSDEAGSRVALERFQQSVDEYNRNSSHGYEIGFSVGVTAYDSARHGSIEALLSDADAQMYERKRRKRAG
jgi:diguanylate cyclase (GGDEF)-like protein